MAAKWTLSSQSLNLLPVFLLWADTASKPLCFLHLWCGVLYQAYLWNNFLKSYVCLSFEVITALFHTLTILLVVSIFKISMMDQHLTRLCMVSLSKFIATPESFIFIFMKLHSKLILSEKERVDLIAFIFLVIWSYLHGYNWKVS